MKKTRFTFFSRAGSEKYVKQRAFFSFSSVYPTFIIQRRHAHLCASDRMTHVRATSVVCAPMSTGGSGYKPRLGPSAFSVPVLRERARGYHSRSVRIHGTPGNGGVGRPEMSQGSPLTWKSFETLLQCKVKNLHTDPK